MTSKGTYPAGVTHLQLLAPPVLDAHLRLEGRSMCEWKRIRGRKLRAHTYVSNFHAFRARLVHCPHRIDHASEKM